MCPPTGLRVLKSFASLFGFTLYRANAKAPLLQIGAAESDLYVLVSVESQMCATHVWFLLTATHGRVNANANWQAKSDAVLLNLGLEQSKHIPQQFFKKKNGKPALLAAKIIDDLEATDGGDYAKEFLAAFDRNSKFGLVSHEPCQMKYLRIKTIQQHDLFIAKTPTTSYTQLVDVLSLDKGANKVINAQAPSKSLPLLPPTVPSAGL